MRHPTAELQLYLTLLLVLSSTHTVATAENQQNPPSPRRGRLNSPYLPPIAPVEVPVNWPNAADFRAKKQAAKDRVNSMSIIYGDSQHLSSSSKYTAEKLFRSAVHKHASNDLNGAIADYLAAIKIYDKVPAVHWYLGTAYKAAGKTSEAKREFEKEQAMKQSLTENEFVRAQFIKSYKSGAESGYGEGDFGLNEGDFGSNRLKFVPSEGMTKVRY
jgi:tetratricopeptide (TPR) repeat protein